MDVTIGAPLPGTLVPLSAVPDPVFAQEIVGPGVAIEPAADIAAIVVSAPVAGRVASLFPHAFALQTSSGHTVLVHLGIDTVRLDGHGFDLHVAVGDELASGDRVITWDTDVTRGEGLATVCPVVALQGDPAQVRAVAPLGSQVDAGEPIAGWHTSATTRPGEPLRP